MENKTYNSLKQPIETRSVPTRPKSDEIIPVITDDELDEIINDESLVHHNYAAEGLFCARRIAEAQRDADFAVMKTEVQKVHDGYADILNQKDKEHQQALKDEADWLKKWIRSKWNNFDKLEVHLAELRKGSAAEKIK